MRVRNIIFLSGLMATCIVAARRPAAAQRRAQYDEPHPAIYRSPSGEWQVDLPPGMEDALNRYARYFDPWTQEYYRFHDGYEFSPRQVPWAVIGDFNGDGRPDLAIAGRDDRNALVLVLLSTGRSRYRVVEIDREPYDPDDPHSIQAPVLRYMYPGRYVVDDRRLPYATELLVDQPAIQVTGGRRPGAVLYVVEQNGLTPYYLSTQPVGGHRRVPRPRRDTTPDSSLHR